MTLVDANVLLDVATDDPRWADWSERQFDAAISRGPVIVSDIAYAEFLVGYSRIEDAGAFLAGAGVDVLPVPRPGLFLAGEVHRAYRARGGTRTGVLPDFLIGVYAAVAGVPLLTRDTTR
ncbi:MAG TPA: type II toxin-antitoxin system VapC family toxin, partial [Acetobacteraceae bacterium]